MFYIVYCLYSIFFSRDDYKERPGLYYFDTKFNISHSNRFCQNNVSNERILYFQQLNYCNINHFFWKLDTTLFQKPNTLCTYTHFFSNVPLSTKTGTIRGQLIRLIKLCSSIYEYNNQKAIYFEKLKIRGYPINFLLNQIKHPSYSKRIHFINQHNKNNSKHNNNLFLIKYFDNYLENTNKLKDLFKSHLYNGNLLNDRKIMICFKTNKKLKDLI